MNHLDRESLGATLDALGESLFFGASIPVSSRTRAAKWIASRQGLPGAYANMFAPTEADARGFRLFTGEVVRSRAGIGHLLGEEACRILLALQVDDLGVTAALHRAVEGMSAQLVDAERRGYSTNVYCCGTCSAGYWRNLAHGVFPRAKERLRQGLGQLQRLRRGDGEWLRFPFYYTSLALTEIGAPLAAREMRYAATRWRRILPRLSKADDPLARRRAAVGQRLLESCD